VGAFSGDDLPREEISLIEAGAHCQSRNARLPTEAEWEFAARGPDSLEYAWGEAFNGHILNWCDVNCMIDWRDVRYDDGYGTTAPVGSYAENASWVGALDLGGNVWEWTSSLYEPYPYEAGEDEPDGEMPDRARVIRGGAWDHLAFDARTANRARVAARYAFHTIGLRCVRDY
jgi:formylglycine-generating enzyme required for sulfatase activity